MENKHLILLVSLMGMSFVTQSHGMFKAFATAAARMSTYKWARPVVGASVGAVALNIKSQDDLSEKTKMLTSGATDFKPMGRTDVIIKTIAQIEHEKWKVHNSSYDRLVFERPWPSQKIDFVLYKGPYQGFNSEVRHYYKGLESIHAEPEAGRKDNETDITTHFGLYSNHPISDDILRLENLRFENPRKNFLSVTVNDSYTKCWKHYGSVQCKTKGLPMEVFHEKMAQYQREFENADKKSASKNN